MTRTHTAHPLKPTEAEAAILARMAETRVALLAANGTAFDIPAAATRPRARHPATEVVTALSQTPRVTVLLALCAGLIALGPRRTLAIAGRSGAAAWVGSSMRKLVQRNL